MLRNSRFRFKMKIAKNVDLETEQLGQNYKGIIVAWLQSHTCEVAKGTKDNLNMLTAYQD